MTNKSSAASPQIEADRCLLQFSSYDDYLDALVIPQDECLLGSTEVCRTIAELGYRSSGETMSREQFEKRLAAVYAYLHPSFKPGELSSDGLISEDNLQQDLALREKSNRVGFLSTIVFLKYFNKAGCEISGYIDYADKLTKEDWKPFFKGKKKILLKKTDLGYYNWRSGKVVSNNSLNYKVLQSPKKGLIFQNRFDRRIINPAPGEKPGYGTTRKRVYSDGYDIIIIWDHVVRQRT